MRSRRRYGCLGGAAFVSMVEATKSQNICPQATDPSRRLLHPVLGGEHRQQSDPQPCDGAGRVAGPRPRSRGSRVGYRVGWTRQAVPARPEGWIAASSGNRSFIKKGTYVEYYQRSRAHLVLDKDAHVSRPVASAAEGGDIVVIPRSVACTTGTNAAPHRSCKPHRLSISLCATAMGGGRFRRSFRLALLPAPPPLASERTFRHPLLRSRCVAGALRGLSLWPRATEFSVVTGRRRRRRFVS